MKIEQLIESPLPAGWDNSMISSKTDFESSIAYATIRAKRIGTGSSRVAFVVPYDGRKTVLKIALDRRGVIQNAMERRILPLAEYSEIMIPMIDADSSPSPRWIHVEKADQVSERKFKEVSGITTGGLFAYLSAMILKKKLDKKYHGIDFIFPQVHLIERLVTEKGIHLADVCDAGNWGIFNGNLVLIDVGISTKVHGRLYA